LTGSLFSPVYRKRNYRWAKVMDSDGLLVSYRKVHAGEGGAPVTDVRLLLGVVVQSEDSTSQTKPNPLGKAALPSVPNGIWVDLKGEGRRRIDRVLVVFVLPEGAAPSRRKRFMTAKRNVENAADLMLHAVAVAPVRRGASAGSVAAAIMKLARPFLVGAGRPVVTA
jgi:hypothetical protein